MIKKLQLPTASVSPSVTEGKRVGRFSIVSSDLTARTSSNTYLTTPTYSIKGNRSLKISIYVPHRATGNTARGLIIETTLIINGVEYSLGTSGIATNSDVTGTTTIGSYTNTKLLSIENLIKDCGVIKDTVYTLILKVYTRSIVGTYLFNQNHDINRASSGQVGSSFSAASNQNFLSASIKEI